MFCFTALADANEDTIYSDLACYFLVHSFSGTQYIFVAYAYTSYVILIKPMKEMTDADMVTIFKDIYKELEERNHKLKSRVLDNQCSKAVKIYTKSEMIAIQHVKPYNHCVNAAELLCTIRLLQNCIQSPMI